MDMTAEREHSSSPLQRRADSRVTGLLRRARIGSLRQEEDIRVSAERSTQGGHEGPRVSPPCAALFSR
ncbi:MAG: hypothetical protein JWO59_1649 [Chloroflexi bacterium]|nr:hypothetical protein [Chloroflexota bacterium]